MVVFRSGAGGARLRLFEAGPAAPNLHLKNVLRVKSDVVSEPEADGARLRLLEPAFFFFCGVQNGPSQHQINEGAHLRGS